MLLVWTSQEQREVVVHQSKHNPSEQALDLLYVVAGWWIKTEWVVDVCASWAGSSYRKYDDSRS